MPATEASVLIVDDDPIARELMRESLEGDGFAVIEAGDGAEACRLCEEHRPLLLVVDVVMPGMDGFELCRELRRRPSSAHLPILMATGLDDVASITAAYEAGATDFIAKPINWLILNHRVRYMLRAGRAFDEAQRANELLERRVNERTAELQATQGELLKHERFAALGQLTATVAHELNNPLGAIRNTLSAVKVAQNAGRLDIGRAVERMDRCVTRCHKIIADLLDYTRVRDLRVRRVALDSWLDAVLDEQAIPESIILERRLDAPGALVDLDPEKFRRVVVNIVENAVQALEEAAASDERRIIVSTRSADAAQIIIADTGPGIPSEVRMKVFEPLFSTKSFGAGLGLATVRQIVEQHGGVIEIAGETVRGASFRISLPPAAAGRVAA